MSEYFNRYIYKWKEFNETLPQTSWIEEAGNKLYVGEKDEEGYVSWLPVDKEEIYDFKVIEQKLNFSLNESVKAYFNSYYFFQLSGWIKEYNVNLNPVIPNIEPTRFIKKIIDYRQEHGGELRYIPIGIESNGLLLVIDNSNGKVYLEDYERATYEEIHSSLEELIDELRFNE